MRSSGWALFQYDCYLYEERKFGHRPYRRKITWKQKEKTTIYEPKREAWDRITLPTPWYQTSGLKNSEKIHFCCLSYLICYTAILANQYRYQHGDHSRLASNTGPLALWKTIISFTHCTRKWCSNSGLVHVKLY